MAGSMCWYLSSANKGRHASRKEGAKLAVSDAAWEKMSSTPSFASGKAASRILMRRRLALSSSHCAPFALAGSRKLLRRLRAVLPRPTRSCRLLRRPRESVPPDISVVWMVSTAADPLPTGACGTDGSSAVGSVAVCITWRKILVYRASLKKQEY